MAAEPTIIKIDLENGVIAKINIETGNTIFHSNGKMCKIGSLSLRQLNLIHQAVQELD